ncbi:hypothetical protein CEXT_629401 [Caerostris extrusa]|uniref:Uncharacterized protein n=1 Tax=Caerostris extrusa TaxID=172846 RepID=A0AAV4TVF5_CAEEX|nr:hypothetical protein CEXT_629401 [Caerostris extrusa]
MICFCCFTPELNFPADTQYMPSKLLYRAIHYRKGETHALNYLHNFFFRLPPRLRHGLCLPKVEEIKTSVIGVLREMALQLQSNIGKEN